MPRIRHRVTLLLLVSILLTACAQQGGRHAPAAEAFVFVEATIGDVHAALASGGIACEGIVEGYLRRIRAFDQPSGLNTIIRVNEAALARARALDEARHGGESVAPLHCIPVILKDNFDTADMPTEAGSIAMRGFVPPDDAQLVRSLREAGAVVLAKSNMGEWAFSPYQTISSTYGETRNAYDLARVPAGSSGGTASAVAASFGIIGMGTDTGNSIRGPASHLALVGIRATSGRLSLDGVVPLLSNRDVAGPMLRSVRDTALTYAVLAGDDTLSDYAGWLRSDGLRGVRLGVLRALIDTETADPEVRAVMQRAIEDLRAAGAIVIDPVSIPDFDRLRTATGFCSRFHFDLQQYLDALGDAAPIDSLDAVFLDDLYLPQNRAALEWGLQGRGDPAAQDPPCVGVADDPRRAEYLAAVVRAMDDAGVEALIYPSWSNPPRLAGDLDSPHGNNSPVIAPHTGQPAITVPMGFSSNGLPLGLQFLARPNAEDSLFRFAYAYEQHTRHRRPPSGFGALPAHP